MTTFWKIGILIIFKGCFCFGMCPNRCTCLDNKLIVYCNQSLLNLVPITLNPETEKLFLNHNQIKLITASFIFYYRLQVLDLSSNFISSIGPSEFASQKHLTVFQLSNNRISSLTNSSLLGLFSLRILNLSDNSLVSLNKGSFTDCGQLEKLDLSRNNIKIIEAGAFFGLKKLKELNLGKNKISKLFSNSFHHLPSLLKLDLSSNLLIKIHDFVFSSLINLIDLNLNFCQFDFLSFKCLSKKNNLQKLSLLGNQLISIPNQLIKNLPNLKELHFGGNKFTEISSNAFKGCKSLQSLIVRHSYQLSYIDVNAFSDLLNLDKLIIEHCPALNFIPTNLLKNQKKLSYLNLASNGLSTFSSHLTNWEKLKFVDITNNPIVCNCSVFWMKNFFKYNQSLAKKENKNEVTCFYPNEFKNLPLRLLSFQNFKCSDNTKIHLIILSVLLVLIFFVFGVAIFIVWWKPRFFLFVFKNKRYHNDLREEDMVYEKDHILDKKLTFSSSLYHSPLTSNSTPGRLSKNYHSFASTYNVLSNQSPMIQSHLLSNNSSKINYSSFLECQETKKCQSCRSDFQNSKSKYFPSLAFNPSSSLVVIPSLIKNKPIAKL